jgi:hypothetical protein
MIILRRFRALALTAVVWGLAWLPLGIVLGCVEYLQNRSHPSDIGPTTLRGLLALNAAFFAAAGAISGALFALILMGAERHKTIEQLTFRRLVAWGVAGSVLVPAVLLVLEMRSLTDSGMWLELAIILGGTGSLGGLSAGATLKAASIASPGSLPAPPSAA